MPSDTRSDRPSSYDRGYDTRWRRARIHYLAKHPLCVMCQQEGRVGAATVVDHIVPHRGDKRLFWDVTNWQPLCQKHHDSTKRSQEKLGKLVGCDKDGNPFDMRHHWNAR